jgi:uncharacterized membrane protein
MFLAIAYFVSLFCVGLAAGVGVETVLQNAAIRLLSAEGYVAMHQQLERVHARVMPVFVNLALLASIVVAILERSRLLVVSLEIVGIGALLVAIANTIMFELPINRQIHSWTASAPPEKWSDARDRWIAFNNVRQAAMQVALICLLAALVIRVAGL